MCEDEDMWSRRATWMAAVLAVVLVFALVFAITTLVNRFQAMEQHVSALAEKVERSARAPALPPKTRPVPRQRRRKRVRVAVRRDS